MTFGEGQGHASAVRRLLRSEREGLLRRREPEQGAPLVNIAQVFAFSGMRQFAFKTSGIRGVACFCVRESEPSHLGHLARQERRRGGCRAADRVAGRGLARPGALVVLDPQLRHEVRVAGALDDCVELRAVVGDEADALERDVIGAPAAPCGNMR